MNAAENIIDYLEKNSDVVMGRSLELGSFPGCVITPSQLEKICEWLQGPGSRITSVSLGSNDLDDQHMEVLAKWLWPKKLWLSRLHLQYNKITASGIELLVKALEKNSHVTNLNLDGNQIGDVGAQHLARLVSKGFLQDLSISKNEIGEKGMTAMSEVLKENKSLHTLYCCLNPSVPKTWEALSSGLAKNQGLKKLWLSGNSLGETASLVFASLKSHGGLVELDVSANKISDSSIESLCSLLRSNKNLTSLDLFFNKLGDTAIGKLCEGLEESKLVQLDVSENPFSLNSWKTTSPHLQDVKLRLGGVNVNEVDPNSDWEGIGPTHTINVTESTNSQNRESTVKVTYQFLVNPGFETEEIIVDRELLNDLEPGIRTSSTLETIKIGSLPPPEDIKKTQDILTQFAKDNPMIESIKGVPLSQELSETLEQNKMNKKTLQEGLEEDDSEKINKTKSPLRNGVRTSQGKTLLHWAVENGLADFVLELLIADAPMGVTWEKHGTPLDLANTPEIKGLIEQRLQFDKLMSVFKALNKWFKTGPLRFYVWVELSKDKKDEEETQKLKLWSSMLTKHLMAAGALPVSVAGEAFCLRQNLKDQCEVVIAIVNKELSQRAGTSQILEVVKESQNSPKSEKKIKFLAIKWKSEVEFGESQTFAHSEGSLFELKYYYDILIGTGLEDGLLSQLFCPSQKLQGEYKTLYSLFAEHFKKKCHHDEQEKEVRESLKKDIWTQLSAQDIDKHFDDNCWVDRIKILVEGRSQVSNLTAHLAQEQQENGLGCFISYAWGDPGPERTELQRQLKQLSRWLNAMGFNCWRDLDDMVGYVRNSMADGIRKSKFIFPILTPQLKARVEEAVTKNPNSLQFEVETIYKARKNKTIIPLLMKGTPEQSIPGKYARITDQEFSYGNYLYIDMSSQSFARRMMDIGDGRGIISLLLGYKGNGSKPEERIFIRLHEIFVDELISKHLTRLLPPTEQHLNSSNS